LELTVVHTEKEFIFTLEAGHTLVNCFMLRIIKHFLWRDQPFTLSGTGFCFIKFKDNNLDLRYEVESFTWNGQSISNKKKIATLPIILVYPFVFIPDPLCV
jgi:hypothetical protein